MKNVAIVTDSAVCLPRELTKRYGIEVVPLRFSYRGRVYQDGIDITPEEIYRILPEAAELPTTSSPSPGDYCEALERATRERSSVLLVTISAKFSSMIESAKVGTELVKEKRRDVAIEVLDCGTAAGAQGLVVLAAARAADGGRNLAGVVEVARDIMARITLVAYVDTLHYLVKGGRVPRAVVWANTLIRIKPVFRIAPLSGEARVIRIARTRQGAIRRLLELVKRGAGGKAIHATVMHSGNLAEAQVLEQRLLTQVRCKETYVSDFSPAMGIHSGPGVLGIAFYGDDEPAR